jgi:glucan phosphoethanolaminetransferase (alkaline phosphatase superfamily)
MDKGLLHLHNLLRWVILLLLLWSLFQAFTKNNGLRKSSLWLLIAAHTTLVIGLYQWFTGPWGLQILKNNPMKEVMGNSALRFWAVEHITCMILAIIFITVARRKAKMLNYKSASWLYLLALLLILAGVPWPFREAIARPWFPGM